MSEAELVGLICGLLGVATGWCLCAFTRTVRDTVAFIRGPRGGAGYVDRDGRVTYSTQHLGYRDTKGGAANPRTAPPSD